MSNCVFGKMGKQKYTVSNYLDKDEKGNRLPIKTRDEMIKTINDLHHKCGYKWHPT